MRTLWIVSGGVEAVPGIRRAKELGLHVVVSDGNPHAPGFAFADDTIVASTYDIQETVGAAHEYHKRVRALDGIICMASDVPLTVASVAEALGLPGIPLTTAQLASDKLAMKERFAEARIPTPWFSPVESSAHLSRLVRERGLPLVLKPVDSRGARGVLRLTRALDLDWAYREARRHSPTERVMVEEYLAGPQISTESILLEGVAFTPGFSDRNYEFLERFAPHFIENGGQQPSALGKAERQAVRECAESAARAMGIRTGVAKGDMVLTPDGPKVIEIAARLSGGWFSTDQIPLGTGVDFVGAAIRLALGESLRPADLVPRCSKGVSIRYFFPNPGRVVDIRGVSEAQRMLGIHAVRVFVRPGDRVLPTTNHTERAGFVIAVGSSREEAICRAEQAVATVDFAIQPP